MNRKSVTLAHLIQNGANNAQLRAMGFSSSNVSTIRRRLLDGASVSDRLGLVFRSDCERELAEAIYDGTSPRLLMLQGYSAQDIHAIYGLLRREKLIEPWPTGSADTPSENAAGSSHQPTEASAPDGQEASPSTADRLRDLWGQIQEVIKHDPKATAEMLAEKIGPFLDGVAESFGTVRSSRFLYAYDYQAGTDLEFSSAFHMDRPELPDHPDKPADDVKP